MIFNRLDFKNNLGILGSDQDEPGVDGMVITNGIIIAK
jgi:hypothetical protein